MASPSRDTPDLRFVGRGTEEWLYLWSRLRREFGDTTARDPSSGECWQYVGTVYLDNAALTYPRRPGLIGLRPGWFHEFRHRSHPEYLGTRLYWVAPASHSYQLFESHRKKQERVNPYTS